MAVQVTMYLTERDSWHHHPLHLEILKYLRAENVFGAVVFHAVAGFLGVLAGHFFDHLSAHVFMSIFEFDLFCYAHAVFGHDRCAKFTVYYYVASFGAEGHFYSVGQFVYACFKFVAGVTLE